MFSVFIPVGSSDADPERLADTLDSLRAHAPVSELRLTLIDDGPEPRDLERLWPGATIVRTALWDERVPDRVSAQTAGTIEALKRAQGDFALKLDTDAVVIAPFVDSIHSILARDPSIGIIGAFDRAAAGGRRDWSRWPPLIRRARWPLRAVRVRGAIPRITVPSASERNTVRRVIRAASANPLYALGAHCLGGAYAVSPSLFAHRELLDWRPWVATHLAEDVTLGLLCGAAGLRMQNAIDAAEPFAVSWKGLPAEPSRLLAGGHSIVHSVKDDPHGTEWELREWFRINAR
jgi:hypothetical protein